MKTRSNGLSIAMLAINHIAGMIGLIILAVWIGVLAQYCKYGAQQAAAFASLFLATAVITSIIFASFYERVPKRLMTTVSFLVAAVIFFLPLRSASFSGMLIPHSPGGVGSGWGLSLAHGTIGRSDNPHRLFSMVQLALGLTAILFFAIILPLILKTGGATLFMFPAGLAPAAVIAAAAFDVLAVPVCCLQIKEIH